MNITMEIALDICKSKINKVLDTITETTIQRCARRQKRGKRGGIRARLAASPTRPAIPSIIMANVRSLDNKMDLSYLNVLSYLLCLCTFICFTVAEWETSYLFLCMS